MKLSHGTPLALAIGLTAALGASAGLAQDVTLTPTQTRIQLHLRDGSCTVDPEVVLTEDDLDAVEVVCDQLRQRIGEDNGQGAMHRYRSETRTEPQGQARGAAASGRN